MNGMFESNATEMQSLLDLSYIASSSKLSTESIESITAQYFYMGTVQNF